MNKESIKQIRAFLATIEKEKQKIMKSKENIRTLIDGVKAIIESVNTGVDQLEGALRELNDGIDSLSEYM